MKTTIWCFYDALCGWCYGFSPVIQQLHEQLNDQEGVTFKLISGGLKYGADVGAIDVVAPYIKAGAYKEVERRTGVVFGAGFVEGTLAAGTMLLDSEPPAIAMVIIKEALPAQVFPFASLLHQAIYVDGIEPQDWDAYAAYAKKVGYEGADFGTKMRSLSYQAQAIEEFELAKAWGIRGFPTVVLEQEGQYHLIARGHTDLEVLQTRLNSFNLAV